MLTAASHVKPTPKGISTLGHAAWAMESRERSIDIAFPQNGKLVCHFKFQLYFNLINEDSIFRSPIN